MNHMLFAHQTGEGSPPLVLLHGFGGSHRIWSAVQEALCQKVAVIAYDLPGHGASLDFPQGGPVKMAVRAVLDDLAQRGVKRVHLAGHSMGGAVAAIIASRAPKLVSSLTLFAPGGFGPQINHRLLARYAAAANEAEMRPVLEAMMGFDSQVPEKLLRDCLALREIPGQREKLKEIRELLCGNGRQGVIPREWLEGLTMPVTVVWGMLDNVLPIHQSNDLPPRFALHRIAGAGHSLIAEAPELAAQIMGRQFGSSG